LAGQKLGPLGDGSLGNPENVVLPASGLYIETMRYGPRPGEDIHVVSGDRCRLVTGPRACKYEMLRAVGKVGAESKHLAPIDQ
jgi:hypothetical protein